MVKNASDNDHKTDSGNPTSTGTPRVFISYAWTSPSHKQWVLDLATRLRGDGVDIILDVWDLKEGQDKYKFMERMIRDSSVKKVLVISNSHYARKADSREGGVGEETQIITPEIYSNAGSWRKAVS